MTTAAFIESLKHTISLSSGNIPEMTVWNRNMGAKELEWVNQNHDCSLEIHENIGYWHTYDFSTKVSEEKTFNITDSDACRNVADMLAAKFV